MRKISEKSLQKELERLSKMREFEDRYADYAYICGVDEVGRGPFAGPVVAAAVILPKDATILYLNDSKKVSEKRRLEVYEEIKEQAIAYAIGVVSSERIDEINILQATYEAMRQALDKLQVQPDILLNDAVHIPDIHIKQVGIVKGDAKSISIAAASIIAKVERDALMVEYAKLYPQYALDKNKGYGTKEHIDAIKAYGLTPIHRRSFVKKYI